jgi:Raf kinase inhibitor-like YbhB/YbcL family protein
MILTSSAFAEGGQIPRKFTCDGIDISPPLMWSGVPPGTKSLVLFIDDPDAPDPAHPGMDWTHWLLYNIPPQTTSLKEGLSLRDLPKGTLAGWTDWKSMAYRGPCPPVGNHRYFHRLHALDTVLPDLGRASKTDIEAAMRGHILGTAVLVGKYRR